MDVSAIISLILGYAIIAGAFILKVPQILKMVQAGNAKGLTLTMFGLETLGFSIQFAYGWLKGFPFQAYGESFVILIQVYIIVFLMLKYNGQLSNPSYLAAIALYFAAFVPITLGLFPLYVVETLQSINIFITIGSRVPQIIENHKNKSVGQLSGITCLLNFGGSLARIFTSLQETGDTIMIATFVLATTLNGILWLQTVILPTSAPTSTGSGSTAKPSKPRKFSNPSTSLAMTDFGPPKRITRTLLKSLDADAKPKKSIYEPPTSFEPKRKRDRRDKGSPTSPKKRRSNNVYTNTKIPLHHLPLIFQEILKKIPNDLKNKIDTYKVQNLLVEKCIGLNISNIEDFKNLSDEIIKEILQAREMYTSNKDELSELNKYWVDQQTVQDALNKYNENYNSPAEVAKRAWRSDEYVWTSEDLEKFKVGCRKFANEKYSNKLIAEFVGNGVHSHQVAMLRKKLRKLQKAQEKQLPLNEKSKTKKLSAAQALAILVGNPELAESTEPTESTETPHP